LYWSTSGIFGTRSHEGVIAGSFGQELAFF
jgi:hypothetical protein